MILGNRPTQGEGAIPNKFYWWLIIGERTITGRFLGDGWRAFEFVILKPYKEALAGTDHPVLIKIAFAYWLPISKL